MAVRVKGTLWVHSRPEARRLAIGAFGFRLLALAVSASLLGGILPRSPIVQAWPSQLCSAVCISVPGVSNGADFVGLAVGCCRT
jgi:hypothetical protein